MKRPAAGEMFTVRSEIVESTLQFEMPESDESEIDFHVYTGATLKEEEASEGSVTAVYLRIEFT